MNGWETLFSLAPLCFSIHITTSCLLLLSNFGYMYMVWTQTFNLRTDFKYDFLLSICQGKKNLREGNFKVIAFHQSERKEIRTTKKSSLWNKTYDHSEETNFQKIALGERSTLVCRRTLINVFFCHSDGTFKYFLSEEPRWGFLVILLLEEFCEVTFRDYSGWSLLTLEPEDLRGVIHNSCPLWHLPRS